MIAWRMSFLAFSLLALYARVGAESQHLERPRADDGPTPVHLQIFIIDVGAIHTAEQTFTANILFRARWNDPRLASPDAETKQHPLEEVWHPQLNILNRQKVWETLPALLQASSDGTVTSIQRVWGTFSYPLFLEEFPFDEHTLGCQLVSSRYGTNEVVFVKESGRVSGLAEELTLADFTITSHEAVPYVYQPVPDAQAFSGFEFRFTAKRDSNYYVVKVLIPLALIVAMSWIVFWIDPKHGGSQISLSATAMLTLIAYRFAVTANLPKVGYLTRMDDFILGATLMVFAGLVEVVVTFYLAEHGGLERARRLDRCMRFVFPSLFVALLIKAFVL